MVIHCKDGEKKVIRRKHSGFMTDLANAMGPALTI